MIFRTFVGDLRQRLCSHRALSRRMVEGFIAGALFLIPFALVPLVRSQETVVSWERVGTWPGGAIVSLMALSSEPERPLLVAGPVTGVYLSYDAGDTWIRPPLPLPGAELGATQIRDLAINPDHPDQAYAIVTSPAARPRPMLYLTLDGGQTWHAQGGLGPKRLSVLAFGDSENALYFVATGDIYRALIFEGGESFFIRDNADLDRALVTRVAAQTEVTCLAVGAWPEIQVDDDQYKAQALYVGTRGQGLQIFVDAPGAGPIWVPAAENAESRYVRDKATIETVLLDRERPRVAWVGTPDGIYATIDGGSRWFVVSEQLRDRTVYAINYDTAHSVLYAGLADYGVWFSRDHGVSWSHLSDGLGRADVYSLLIDSTRRVLYAGTSQGLWRLRLDQGMI